MKPSKTARTALWIGAATLAATGWAFAAAEPGSAARPSEFVFLAQIAVLIFVGRLLGEAMQRIGQPSVMGQLIGGLLLGPSVLGALWPAAQHAIFPSNPAQASMIDAVSQLGVLLLLLLTGMETDLGLVRRVGRAAILVSIAGICLPFLCGFTLGELMPQAMLPNANQRTIAALFLGTALSISSVKIVAMVVREMNFVRRNLGQVILSSAIIDDTIGWIIIAVTLSLASRGRVDALSLAQGILGTAIFLAVSLTIGRRLVFGLIRWANDHLMSEVPIITVILLVMAVMALTTDMIGVHTVLGAFVAGILIGESPIFTRRIDQQLRGLIMGLFAPVFFGVAGLNADLTILKDPALLMFTAGLVLIASIGKASGAFVGGKLAGLTMRESLALAFAMNARGSTEVIVATIGLSMGVLNHDLFTMIVAMAVVTTMAMPPMLRWALARVPADADETARLAREEFEARGFVSNLERVLLAVDDSANGKFASRLAGLIAGSRGMPTTVLNVGRRAKRRNAVAAPSDGPEAHVRAAAEGAAAPERGTNKAERSPLDVVTRTGGLRTGDAVVAEARRGYDLLVIGIDRPLTAQGRLRNEVVQAAAGFDGPLAIVVGRGRHLEDPKDSALKILLPTTGTDVSRRAAEVAITLARAVAGPLTALYVAAVGRRGSGRVTRAARTRRDQEAVLKDVVALAEVYDTPMRTAVAVDAAAEDAILRHARDRGLDLIVMGVNRRPGATLFFGHVVATVLERADASVLLISDSAAPGTNMPETGTGSR